VAAKLGVMDCFSCGSCSYVCPSHIPLVHYFNYAKGMLNVIATENRKNERVKSLAEARVIRLDKAAEAKKAALAAKKPATATTGEASAATTTPAEGKTEA
jgi:electron transport complex protein RnfC